MGSLTLLDNIPSQVLASTQDDKSHDSHYKPGRQISSEAFVTDKYQQKHRLIDLCKSSDAKVVFLYIFGGAVLDRSNRLGNIWCPDSFEDMHTLRFVESKYKDNQVKVLPVACPPVYSSQYYGFGQRVFLDEPESSKKFNESTTAFVEKTEEIVQSGLIPTETYYDLRFRLLFNRRENLLPSKNYGTIFNWQGKFRALGEKQKYGTPTSWLLNSRGIILEEPFWGNIYHSEPYQIRYTILDVDKAIQRHL
jgi:thiol-disulfide isomerase/thioredoxin